MHYHFDRQQMSRPSVPQLEQHIRRSAQDSANVAWTVHADVQMRKRKLNRVMALEVLRTGVLVRPPEPGIRHLGMTCRMERFVAGVQVAVVVAVEYPAPELVIVTVIDVKGE